MKNVRLLPTLVFILLCSCQTEEKAIIEHVSFTEFFPDTITSMTVEESSQRGLAMRKKVLANTENRYIPNIQVQDLDSNAFVLTEILEKNTLLYKTDAYCGFGKGMLRDDLIPVFDSIFQNTPTDLIVLIAKTPADIKDPELFQELVAETSEYVEDIYIIKEADAIRINMESSPSRYYVRYDGKVVMAAYGMPMKKEAVYYLMSEAKRRLSLEEGN